MLSPADLFAARSRQQSLPQRSHGQKDFLPDGSAAQDAKLRTCRAEQWQLLGEERVERLGSLGRGVWRPQEGVVELTLPAGKFWQTMGFTKAGRQYLLPEEALYLLECGAIQLWYEEVPLCVQEAYEALLTNAHISVPHYQVYSHLKRLGYIVTRFNPSSVKTPYETQLNLDGHAACGHKRKRSPSPCLRSKLGATLANPKEQPLAPPSDPHEEDAAPPIAPVRQAAEDLKSRHADVTCSHGSPCAESATPPANPRWDFSKICFPNCAPDQPRVQLADPEAALLPSNVSGRDADASDWLRKLNVRREKTSRREEEQRQWERKYKAGVNANPRVRNCANWKQYKELVRERARHGDRQRPPHLWGDGVHPLLTPAADRSTASVLQEIAVMSQTTLLDDSQRIQKMPNLPQIHFNLHQADGAATFKKSKPGRPYARLCVRSFDEQIPSLLAVKALANQSTDVPVVFALVDFGEVVFYTFKDFQLPADVYP